MVGLKKSSLVSLFIIVFIVSSGNVQVSQALDFPIPQVSASVSSVQVNVNSRFSIEFTVSNIGSPSSTDSYLSISISHGLDIISWSSTPSHSDLSFDIYEIGDLIWNDQDEQIPAEHVLLDVLGHPFGSGESVAITVVFESPSSQSSDEWIKYRVAMLPEGVNYPTDVPTSRDPASSAEIDQQGYPVYMVDVDVHARAPFPEAGEFCTLAGRRIGWEIVEGKNTTYQWEEIYKWSVQDVVSDVAFVNRTWVYVYISPGNGENYTYTEDYDYEIATNRTILSAYWKRMGFTTAGLWESGEGPVEEDVGEHTWAWFPTDLYIGAEVLVSWTTDNSFLDDMLYAVVGEEVIQILGEKQDCWVLRMPPSITIDGVRVRTETYWVDEDKGVPLKLYGKEWALDGSWEWAYEYVLVHTNIDLGLESTRSPSSTYTLTVPTTPSFPEDDRFYTYFVLEEGWHIRDTKNVTYYLEGVFSRWVVNVTDDEVFFYKIIWYEVCEEGVEELEDVEIYYLSYRVSKTTREILEVAGSSYHINMTSLTYDGPVNWTPSLAGDVGEETDCWFPTNLYLGATIDVSWTIDGPGRLDNSTYTVVDEEIISVLEEPQACWVLYLPPTSSSDGTMNHSRTYFSDKDVGIPLGLVGEYLALDGSSAIEYAHQLIDTNVDLGPTRVRFNPKVDGFGFPNYGPEPGCIAYTFRQVYDRIKNDLKVPSEIPLEILAWVAYQMLTKAHEGHCGGMCRATLYYYDNPEMIPNEFGKVYEIKEMDKEAVFDVVDYYQTEQFFYLNRDLKHILAYLGDDPTGLLSTVDEISWFKSQWEEGTPVCLTVLDPQNRGFLWGHNVVAYDYEEDEDNLFIYFYNPNDPGNEDAYLWLKKEGNELTVWYDGTGFMCPRFYFDDGPTDLDWGAVAEYLFDMILPEVIDQIKSMFTQLLSIDLLSYAELHVYDSDRNHVGLGSSRDIELGFDALFYVDDTGAQHCVIPNPEEGDYLVELAGVGEGSYTLSITSILDGATVSEEIISGRIGQGITRSYKVKLADDGTLIVLDVTSHEAIPLWMVGVAIAIIAIATVTTAVLWRKRKHPSARAHISSMLKERLK